MILRPATERDVPALSRLGEDSFRAAFGHLYDPADLSGFLASVYSREAVAGEIADPAFIHCLAERDGKLIGFCKLKMPGWYDGHSSAKNPISLGQLYVAPSLTGGGVGAALMEWALEEARARQADAIQLSVWSGNHGAQRFYARYGFSKIADIYFWVGNHRDDEYLYELRLS